MPDVPTSLRVPGELKELLDEAARKANQSNNDFIIRAIQMRIDGACAVCGRDRAGADYWDRQLAEWLDAQVPKAQVESRAVTIATNEPGVGRIAYFGTLRREWVQPAQIIITVVSPRRMFNVPVARRFITNFGGIELHQMLTQTGYVDFVAMAERGRSGGR